MLRNKVLRENSNFVSFDVEVDYSNSAGGATGGVL